MIEQIMNEALATDLKI